MEATAVAAALESAIVGQAQARLGLLLALVAREHAYLEGPPGCGKSLLAETLVASPSSRTSRRCSREVRPLVSTVVTMSRA